MKEKMPKTLIILKQWFYHILYSILPKLLKEYT